MLTTDRSDFVIVFDCHQGLVLQEECLMSLNELLPTLKGLPRADKLRIMQFLISELAREEGALLEADAQYPVWSPYDSFDAAGTLLNALKAGDENA